MERIGLPPQLVVDSHEGWCQGCKGMELVARRPDGRALCDRCAGWLPPRPPDVVAMVDDLLTRLARAAKQRSLEAMPPGVEVTVVVSRNDHTGSTYVSASSTLPTEHAASDLHCALIALTNDQ